MSPHFTVRVRRLWPAAVICLAAARSGSAPPAGVKFTIDSRSSIAWWQVSPHLGHLWATTCPEEPSWLPGAGGKSGFADATDVSHSTQFNRDTTRIPLFPRNRVRAICSEAVHGEIVVPDTGTWKGAHGKIAVDAAKVVTTDTWRDRFSRDVLLQSATHPQIILTIDSVVNVAPGGRDSVRALAVGTLSLHGIDSPLSVPLIAWHDAGGVRVRGRWFMPASDLYNKYGFSKMALGLGVGMNIWRELWMGADIVMRPTPLTP